jgi:hypothetical protein
MMQEDLQAEPRTLIALGIHCHDERADLDDRRTFIGRVGEVRVEAISWPSGSWSLYVHIGKAVDEVTFFTWHENDIDTACAAMRESLAKYAPPVLAMLTGEASQ